MRKSVNRTVATIFGAIYVLVGLLGFLVTSGVGFAAPDGGRILGIFEVNPLHNIVHLIIGAVLLYAGSKSTTAAKNANIGVGAAYLLVGIIGLFIIGTSANFLALNHADHFLHFGSALLLLIVGFTQDKRVASDYTATSDTPGSAVL
jgi:hypothetical protein